MDATNDFNSCSYYLEALSESFFRMKKSDMDHVMVSTWIQSPDRADVDRGLPGCRQGVLDAPIAEGMERNMKEFTTCIGSITTHFRTER